LTSEIQSLPPQHPSLHAASSLPKLGVGGGYLYWYQNFRVTPFCREQGQPPGLMQDTRVNFPTF
jgi:hypothetical protein